MPKKPNRYKVAESEMQLETKQSMLTIKIPGTDLTPWFALQDPDDAVKRASDNAQCASALLSSPDYPNNAALQKKVAKLVNDIQTVLAILAHGIHSCERAVEEAEASNRK